MQAEGDGEVEALWRVAATLSRRARARKPAARPLPPLFLFTDPERTPRPDLIAERLPRGAGVVFRSYGRRGALGLARRLRSIARSRGLMLLVGADEGLAARAGAHGVHLPERVARLAPSIRRRRPGWLITVAAHSLAALNHAERAGADAVFLSPVFPSRSPSAGRPLGPERFERLVRSTDLPVYALGGVNRTTAAMLVGSGAAGLAAVEALSAGLRT